MNNKKIPLAGPSITQKEIDYVIDAVTNGWYDTYDMHIKSLERSFENYSGAKYAIATYCGTHALHLATLALGLKAGDEVICVDQSYIATAFAISYVGAIPVFVDIEQDTLCIDVDKIEMAITNKTKAIMIVQFAGFTADMDRMMNIARKYNLKVIEDACQAVGTKYKGKMAGTIGDIGVYSFQGAKIAVGGEGGMFVTNDYELYARALHFATFCRNDDITYLFSDDLGYNYRISNVTAALILAQIERIDELIEYKKNIYNWYLRELDGNKYIQLLRAPSYCETNYGYTVGYLTNCCAFTNISLVKKMLEENIHIRPGYPSMSTMFNYERRFDVSNSIKYFERGIVFPTALNITQEDVSRVCSRMTYHIEVLNEICD